MRFVNVFSFLSASLLVSGAVSAQQATPLAVIESPMPGQSVSTRGQVTINMLGPGHPVVAVRSIQPGSRWWIQDAGTSDDSRTFVVPVRFGNEQTRSGTRFMITALIAKDSQSTAGIEPGAQLDSLPQQFARTKTIEIVVDRDKTSQQERPLRIELISPVPSGRAKWIQPVVVQMNEATEALPRLLVRSAEEGAHWWVQEALQAAGDGRLVGRARIGNGETLIGSRFVLVLVCPENESSRAALKTGAVLKDLSGFRCSTSFTVTSEGSQQDAEETATVAL